MDTDINNGEFSNFSHSDASNGGEGKIIAIINMTTSTDITRRSFLAGLIYFVSSGFLRIDGTLDKVHATGKADALATKLAGFYSPKQSAKVVGFEYLRSVPTEAKASLLVELICSYDGEQRALAQADKHKLKELLLLRQCQDFEHERVVNVRGWILSKTECRVCALAALI